jgi:hypothetical protein
MPGQDGLHGGHLQQFPVAAVELDPAPLDHSDAVGHRPGCLCVLLDPPERFFILPTGE